MHADNSILDEGCQRQPIEHGVDSSPGKDTLLLTQTLYALHAEAKECIDVCCLQPNFSQT
jgi:hypothetical protein